MDQQESTKQITKDFNSVLKDIIKGFHNAIALNVSLAKAGPGAVLSIPSEVGSTQFGKKEVRQINANYIALLNNLKQYVRAARKKVRKAVEPGSFAGVYTPVYVGAALQGFFKEANFGPVDPKTSSGGKLIDQLTLMQGGYTLRNSITMMFYIHNYAESLQNASNAQLTRSSAAMLKAFGGKIPAEFYSQKEKDSQGRLVKSVKVRTVESSDPRIQKINTYSIIQGSNPDFDGNQFKTYFFQNIASANYYSINDLRKSSDLTGAAGYLEDPKVRAGMLAEHQLIKSVSDVWKGLREAEKARKKAACP